MNSKLTTAILLGIVMACTVEGLVFEFGKWEYCYGEPATDRVNVENALVRVVQSPNHLLGFQFHVNMTTNEPIANAVANLRTWHEQTGDRVKYGDSDACCGFFTNTEDQCTEETNTHCPITGFKSGMIERLFHEEHHGNFEAQLQLFDVSKDREEIMCIAVPFTVSESFLTQFQQERKEKFEEQPILLL
uniref:MD-2-related lipid-recognition domain-containing protein n=1 Tax=Vannella robusta TaxID=1487602 RepID=A0A7S4I057_9EUKA|mmetsp:Transcript_185/g.227  ORF Transcript_185/g.227 Transcript_185/m.227 type:complete len:189 (+) Transcript_185:94-660(+)